MSNLLELIFGRKAIIIAVIFKILLPLKYPGLRLMSSEQMKNSFSNFPPMFTCFKMAKVASSVTRPQKCYNLYSWPGVVNIHVLS